MMMLPSEAKTETMPEDVLIASRFGMARKLTVALVRGEHTQAQQIHTDHKLIQCTYERSTVACSISL